MTDQIIKQLQWYDEQITKRSRENQSVQLLPVTKKVSIESIRTAYEAGIRCFGENRFQELRSKKPLLPEDCSWHFIGGLQRNKVKEIVKMAQLIHSVESKELIDEIEKRASMIGKVQQILIEINVGGEFSKHGASPEQAEELILYANEQPAIEVIGFMTVAPFFEDLEKVRPFFRKLREIRDEIEEKTGFGLPELSMGMTHDFGVAIEEGATIVRVGSGIFGQRLENKE